MNVSFFFKSIVRMKSIWQPWDCPTITMQLWTFCALQMITCWSKLSCFTVYICKKMALTNSQTFVSGIKFGDGKYEIKSADGKVFEKLVFVFSGFLSFGF